jgi:hypothetical protein
MMGAMGDREGLSGMVVQCLQKSTGIGAGMNLIHHRECPEVQHISRYKVLVISYPSLLNPSVSPSVLDLVYFCFMNVSYSPATVYW